MIESLFERLGILVLIADCLLAVIAFELLYLISRLLELHLDHLKTAKTIVDLRDNVLIPIAETVRKGGLCRDSRDE